MPLTTEELRQQFEGRYAVDGVQPAAAPMAAGQATTQAPTDPALDSLRGQFEGRYSFEQPTSQQDDYGWGIGFAFRRGAERLFSLPDVAQGDYEELAEHNKEMEQWKLSDEDAAKLEEIRNSEGFWNKAGQLMMEPRLVLQTVAESLPMMAAPIAGAVGGGLAGGAAAGPAAPVGAVAGSMTGGALGSYFTEYYASIGEYFGQEGIDMTNAAQLKAAFQDQQLMNGARDHAMKRGIPIAIFDGLSMGLAGRIAKPVSNMAKTVTGGRRVGAGVAAELTTQAGFGMAGEAGAQLASEGEIHDELDVLMEGFAELAPGVVEAGVSNYVDRKAAARKAGVQDPNQSPLAALDQADAEDAESGWSPVAATDIDPQTGQPVTRTGDVEQDQLDVALEDGLAGLQMELEAAAMEIEVAEVGAATEQARQGSRNMQMIEMEATRGEALNKQRTRDATLKAQQEEEMYGQRVAEDMAAEVGPAESEMVTPEGLPVEGEPIDVSGAQPIDEGMILDEGINPVGSRPLTTSLGEALRGAGVVEPPDAPPPGGGTPTRGPDVTPAEQRAAESLADEAEAFEERAAIQEADRPATEQDEGLHPEIPFEPLAPEGPKPAQAWADERLADEGYHGALDRLVSETQAGGGTILVPDQDFVGGESDPRNEDGTPIAPLKRLPSTNPPWMQSIVSEEGVGRKYVINAVEKAKAGKRLGAKQKRIVEGMLNEIDQPSEYDGQTEAAPIEEAPAFELEQEQDGVVAPEPVAPEQPRQHVDADIGVPGDMFSPGANAQVDLVDESRAKAREEGDVPAGMKLRESKPSELNELVAETEGLIEKFIEQGETQGGLDTTAIVGAVQKLKLNKHPRAAELERMGRAAIERTGTTSPAMKKEFTTKVKAAYRANELAGKAWQRETKNRPQREAERDAAVQEVLDMLPAMGQKNAKAIVQELHSEHIKSKATGWGMPDALKRPLGFLTSKELRDTPIGGKFETFFYSGIERYEVLARNDKREIALVRRFEDRTIDEDAGADGLYYMGYDADSPGGMVGSFIEEGTTPPERDTSKPHYTRDNYFTRTEAIAHFENELHDSDPNIADPMDFVLDEKKFNEEGLDTERRVFDSSDINPKKRVAIDTKLNRDPVFISLEEADAKITAWEDNAIQQGKDSRQVGRTSHKDNFNRVIISLFDTTGVWANPYALAGYDVRALDINAGIDVTDFSAQFLDDTFGGFDGKEIYGIMAACPCTTFSNSSTRWRKDRHENTDPVESRKWIEEMWGKKAAEAVDEDGNWLYESAHDYAIALVHKTIQTLEYYRPQFWVLENPEGRIEQAANLPGPWRTGFQPSNFGDPYTKRTLLWGNFNEDLPTANVEATEGSKMHRMSPSADRAAKRAETPEGFSYSFFQANNYLDTDPVERLRKDYWYVAGAAEEAMRAGITEQHFRDSIYLDTSYEPEGIAETKQAIRDLINENTGGGGTTPTGTPPGTPPIPSETEIAAAANVADPDAASDAQKEAGNYKKGHMTIAGIPITIENPVGTVRHGNLKLKDHYGYIKRTEGADGDQVDVFVNSKAKEDWAGDVYVVDQIFPQVGGFDEHKVMFGYNNLIDARRAYKRNFNKDWKGEGAVTKMTLDEFNAWLAEPGANKTPASHSSVTEAGRKERAKHNKDLRYASGKDIFNAPSQEWVDTVLNPRTKDGFPVVGDIADTMPMNVAVSELLRIQEQREGAPAAPARPSFEAIAAAIKPVEDSMPGAPVTLLHNYKQAPRPVSKAMQEQGMTQVKAVFDPSTNEIFMFSDQIESIDEATRTSLHEKAHRGLRVAFGDRLNPLLDDVFKGVSEKRQANMQMIADKYKLDPGVLEDRRVIAEELLAHMAEHDVTDGAVSRAIAFIRKILRDMGVTIEFTDNDIRALIREAQGAVSRKQASLEGVTIEEEVTVEGSEEIYVVEQDADVALTGISQRIEICKKLRACV